MEGARASAFQTFKSIRTPIPRDSVELPIRQVPKFLRFFLPHHIVISPFTWYFLVLMDFSLHLGNTKTSNFGLPSLGFALLGFLNILCCVCSLIQPPVSHPMAGCTGINAHCLSSTITLYRRRHLLSQCECLGTSLHPLFEPETNRLPFSMTLQWTRNCNSLY